MDKNIKTALIIGGIVVISLIVLPQVLGLIGGGQYGDWGMMGPGMMGGFGWGWSIFMVLFWGLVIWGVVVLVRGLSQPRGPDSSSGRPESALELLKKRYARGEISKEEFEEKKKDLA